MTLDNVHKRLLDNLKTGVLLLDSDLRLLYMNMEAESLLDISDKKAHQLFIGDVLLNAEDDIAEMRHAVETNNSFTKRAVELTIKHGKTLLADYTINPVAENGNIQAILEVTSLEHSHRITQEESLQTAQLTTKELVRGLAHEIKNPLGGIRGAAQLLAQEIDNPEIQDYTNVIIEEADRLHNLVDRLVGSRKPLELTDINIHEVLERVRSIVEADTASENIRLITDYDPSIPDIRADSDQLIQGMLNLVRNAQQSLNGADKPGGGHIILRTRITRNATIGNQFHRLAVKVEIEDNGPGIPTDMLGTIFYPMISGRADGSGLGLPITHGIITQHQGMIECSSKPGLTVFSVVLPFPSNAGDS
ncbi:MAG: ATP-binding protein [Pseudomonadales bacterium]|nr:ATP-binding protein [Pseudomonadales bacterium]